MKYYLFVFLSFMAITISPCFAQREPQAALQISSLGSLFIDDVDFDVVWPTPKQKGLSVFWWNINRGNVSICTHGERSAINYNLTQIIQSPSRPKIIILGEYLSPGSCLEDSVVALLNKHYTTKITYYTKKNPIYLAFGVFIDKSITLEAYKELDLAWYPNENADRYKTTWKKKCEEAKVASEILYFDRTFPQLDLTVGDKKMSIIPVHFLMPWICDANSGKWWPTWASKKETARKIVFGSDHPLYYQAKDLARKITEDMKNVVIIGDWNIATIKIADSSTHEIFFDLGFSEITQKKWGTYSFPTTFNPEGFEDTLLLDHAFARGKSKTTFSRILPIQGSDHYPLLTYIELTE